MNALTDAQERLVANGRAMQKPAYAVAAALDLVAPEPGCTWSAICVTCLDKLRVADGTKVARLSYGPAWVTYPGDCWRCAYSGGDTLVVALTNIFTLTENRVDGGHL